MWLADLGCGMSERVCSGMFKLSGFANVFVGRCDRLGFIAYNATVHYIQANGTKLA